MERPNSFSDRLLLCCLCTRMLDDPMLLQCLHNCCRQCLENATKQKASSSVTCLLCRRATDAASAVLNTFVGRMVLDARSTRKACNFCTDNGAAGNLATLWCPSCEKSLCESCLPGHHWFNKEHVPSPLEDVASSGIVRQSLCLLHKKKLFTICNNCKAAKCIDCQSVCAKALHDVMDPSSSALQSRMQRLRKDLVASEGVVLGNMAALRKLRAEIQQVKANDEKRIRALNQKKKQIMDAVESAYNSIVGGARNNYECMNLYDGYINSAEGCVDREVDYAVSYIRYIKESDSDLELVCQEKALLSRLEQLSSEIKLFQESMRTPSSILVDSSLPPNLDELIKEWLGMPRGKPEFSSKTPVLRHSLHPARPVLRLPSAPPAPPALPALPAPPAPPIFSQCTGTVKCTVRCWDVAVAPDSRVLLAAGIHGMIEYSYGGQQLSVWRPTLKGIETGSDLVKTVEAISNSHVAVGVFIARTVVLLRRSSATGRAEWLKERDLMVLQSPPHQIASYDDLIAATLSSYDDKQLKWSAGPKLALAPLKDGGCVTHRERKYNVWRVSVTPVALITASCGHVKLEGERRACVIDSHGHQFDVHLWRYVVVNGECVQDMCAEPNGLALYLTVSDRRDRGRMVVVKTANGKELKGKVLSGDNHAVPLSLSLAIENQLTIMAVLWYDPKAKCSRSVTVQSRLRQRTSADESEGSSSRSN